MGKEVGGGRGTERNWRRGGGVEGRSGRRKVRQRGD
jgi:hypothetical protein